MRGIATFEVRDFGEDGSQYFPGDTAMFSPFDHTQVGVGDTAREALEEALEALAMDDIHVSEDQSREMLQALADPDRSALESCHEFNDTRDEFGDLGHPENEECECDWHHYIAIRYTLAYEPKHLKPWKLPECYIGAHWDGYYSAGFGQSRDSDALERSNFQCAWERLKSTSAQIVRESHWAVGWVEWIAIPASDSAALKLADEMCAKVESYPVLNEDHFSQLEQEEADETWKNCYNPKERIAYIRRYRSQFEFRDLADMLGCVRGNYFVGYASELIYR